MDIELKLEEFEIPYTDATTTTRFLKIWKLSSNKTQDQAKPVVISSGFGRAMDQMCALATNLVANGAVVYRYDSLDHVGMSDGEMLDFTLSSGLHSLTTVVDWVAEKHKGSGLVLVSTSLTARIAYRLVSLRSHISSLITAVGVVNVRKTLECVMGKDYSVYAEKDLPLTVEFERQAIGARAFYRDAIKNNWFSQEKTQEELDTIDIPVSAFVASEDEWIDRSNIEAVIRSHTAENRTIYIMEGCEHNFGKNLRSTEYFMNSVIQLACRSDPLKEGGKFIQVDFETILNQSIKERRIQRLAKRSVDSVNSKEVETCEEAPVL